ncbi:glycosyltransferase family 4 protein [Pedobacter sp.]|uniref:glycosyltransferase family 4 protein n=1 Tax=Pedobacter sp. TaxID=1411316 RepID=UPI003D7F98CB
MNIGFDGKRAANNLTGLGNYSRSLIAKLAHFFPQNHYYVYTPKVKDKPQIAAFLADDSIRLKLPHPGAIKLLWRSFGIKKQLHKDQIDVYHGLSQEIPIGLAANSELKTVVTIHDLIYLRYPQYYKAIDRYIYNRKSEYACKKSDHIIAISERTRQDIIEYYNIDPQKIEVIYQSCDNSFKQLAPLASKLAVTKKYNLPDQFLLIVGTIEPRKNLLLLIKALPAINPDYKLVVVGKQQAYARLVKSELEKLGLTDRVIFLEGLPFEDLPLIYQLATLFIYPSLYEGFGIPIIEALYSGTPVIAATGSCLEEAGGPDSIYISPDNAEELAIQANRILDNKDLQEHMIQSGLQYVQRFDNEILANQLMACYLKIINR